MMHRILSRVSLPALTMLAFLTMAIAPEQSRAASRIVAVVNGAVITDLDIVQRQKLERLLSGGKRRLGRSATLAILVDDKLKLFEARQRNMTASDGQISNALNNMARNVRLSRSNMIKVVNRAGVSKRTLESWMKVRLSWQRMVRARYNAEVRINDTEIVQALSKKQKDKSKVKTAYRYDLTSITFVTRKKASKAEVNRRLSEAKRFRTQFKNCKTDIEVARKLKDVAITRIGRRISTDLPPKFAKNLEDTQLNRLTEPSRGKDGFELLAVCGKKDLGKKEAMRSEAMTQLQDQRGNDLARKYLRDLRSRAVIEYR